MQLASIRGQDILLPTPLSGMSSGGLRSLQTLTPISQAKLMKKILLTLALTAAALFTAGTLTAATPEQEKAFVDAYKKAFEAKDEKTLTSFLYTKGADPTVLQFYTMMMTGEMGGKISSIELVALTPEDEKKAAASQPGPGGGNVKIPLKPVKKLVIKVETKDENGSSTSSSESFVAEADGKLVIPVPAPVK